MTPVCVECKRPHGDPHLPSCELHRNQVLREAHSYREECAVLETKLRVAEALINKHMDTIQRIDSFLSDYKLASGFQTLGQYQTRAIKTLRGWK